ncbi:DUF3034 family protein [Pseudomonas sp. 10B1]|uniref:DUF3034 family protein n=1 Tax=unclassified Pseudomonas TaxID=196821 RepID=UPI002AB51D3B|nr:MULTISPECIES: DUF3034 family protein [unclassified Pseudomonas]MDY7561663.1 DUF3034 family protein [Pseudomonas sp. AB6]MEA9978187.1 DUF3034 family protein [Pseudomonas sp. RTS4]MEA9994628.1 DUF3034 family protein [Pseudomonas sp. AA4]MEB0085773.1 DUF3034 family protein [Pseudomonas sp. RTI1]MEB0125902.1 DUF3034 family protein [Pseudomonas sp. CCC1.2]
MGCRLCLVLSGLAILFCTSAEGDQGRLIATGGASSIEGAAGGGVTPWAVLAGYGEAGEWGSSVFATHIDLPDYALDVAGMAVAFDNRVEMSYAHQRLDIGSLAGKLHLPRDSLSQDIFGLKVRLFGDVIYDDLPQVSLGLEYKHQDDFLVSQLAGARRASDVEGYLTASRMFIGAAFGYNLLLNGGVRYSRANELGLLGFGGDLNDTRSLLKEGSVAVLFNPHWAMGMEYREKPDNLSFSGESDWKDLFVGYFPNKHLSFVLAYARLGEIATLKSQNGTYLSVQGSF